jgi:uncharacterized protein (TIGR01777 family)
MLAGILAAELVITLWDFVEEDRTRRLSALERVTHALLTLNYGAVLGLLAVEIVTWAGQPAGFAPVSYGWLSWVMTLYAAGVVLFAGRDLLAAVALARPAWRRAPIVAAPNARPMHVLVTGGTGFIGRALVRRLAADGHAVSVLTRRRSKAELLFGPHATAIESFDEIAAERPVHAVVNLAGAATVGLPWTRGRKRLLLESRLATTRALVDWMAGQARPPLVLVSGSAVGFYGDRADEPVDEAATAATGFMSELCEAWERIATEAEAIGVRTVLLRTGLVLGREGGIFPPLRLAFRIGLGGAQGSGRQWMPWIHRDDLVALILRAVRRPALLTLPAGLLRGALGEMSQLLLAGQRALPRKACASGFRFRYPTLEEALHDLA